jgi:hypothetical protein
MRASDLIGQPVHGPDGTVLGRVADLLARTGPDGTPTVYAVLVSNRRHRLRLFGYERPETTGPWPINRLAKALQGPLREIPLGDIVLPEPDGSTDTESST